MSQPLVLVLGGTGMTGKIIVEALLRAGAFRVAIATRSSTGPDVESLSKKGVETRVVDLATASPPELKAVLEGVNYIVSAMSAEVLETQLPLFEAAKGAGVRRIIPSDFGTSAPPGAFALNDRKLEIRDRVRQLGIPYTFVEIGWWMQLSLPYPPSLEDNQIAPLLNVIYNGGSKKNALTDVRRIGDLVALILQDERTLNQTVFFHEVEASAQEVWDVALQVSGLGESLLSRQVHVDAEELRAQIKAAIARLEQEGSWANMVQRSMLEYAYSMHVQGDNTVENAKRLGTLDARDLYPDLKVSTLEEYAVAFYLNPTGVRY